MLDMDWATSLAFLCAAGLIVGDLGVTGTPSQLRLRHSGYEIISFNDEDPVNPGSLGSPRIGTKNCTSGGGGDDPGPPKVGNSLVENRGVHETRRWSRGSKIGRDTRLNRIDVGSKGPSSTGPARPSGVYLTLGIPGRLVQDENTQKNLPGSVGLWDDSSHRDYSGNRGELVAALIETKIRDEKHKDAAKTGPKFEPVPEDPKVLDRVNEGSPKSQESDQETPPKIVPIADPSRDGQIVKSETARKTDRIGTLGIKSAFTKIAKFPSLRIHNPETYWPPAASPAIFSPMYPSLGFDVTSDLSHKSVIPFVPNEPRVSEIGPKSAVRNANFGPEPHHGAWDLESNDLGAQIADPTSSNQKLPSFMLINSAKHELPMLRTVNRLSLELADLVPFSGASLDVLSLGPKSRGPLEGQLDADSMSHLPWERLDDSDRIVDVGRARAGGDDYDSADLDARINRRTFTNVSRVVPLGSQPDKSNVTSSVSNYRIDIVHGIAPVVHEAPYVAVNKGGTLRDIEDPRNLTRSRDSNAARAKYKRTRNLGVPSFYQFVAKFTDLVLENALRYETSPRGSRDAGYLTGSGRV